MNKGFSVVRVVDARMGMCLAKAITDKSGNIILDAGMYITSNQQIIQFNQLGIKSILVDNSKSLTDFAIPVKLPKSKQSLKKTKSPEQIVSELKEELAEAREFYNASEKVVSDIMHNVRSGKAIPQNVVDNTVKEVIGSISRNYQALLSMTNLRQYDEYTFNHSVNVMVLSLSLAYHLNLTNDEIFSIGKGAILHDIGKAKLPITLINKPGKLSDYEFNLIKTHPIHGLEICMQEHIKDDIVNDIVGHHHESYDGSGYPEHLRTREISKYAAIVSISDFYDALTTQRSYKQVINPPEAINIIYGTSNKKFDRRLVNYFIKTVGIYPVGSIVKLASKRIAMIVGFNSDDLLTPVCKILVNANNTVNLDRETISLAETDDFIEDTNPDIRLKVKLQDVL
ncbi:MAG: HD-GYP domain-containing protein [Candidatus Cloacimonetes bacterium]|nr:HD-GYP domain-containing protein [Candidatus Cloacimonadota bacterium]